MHTTLYAECPPPVTITSSAGPLYEAGDVLTCTANGISPTYKWSGTNGGSSFSSTSSTVTLEEGEFCLICTATVSSFGTTCSACAFLCDSASGKYQKQHHSAYGIVQHCNNGDISFLSGFLIFLYFFCNQPVHQTLGPFSHQMAWSTWIRATTCPLQ